MHKLGGAADAPNHPSQVMASKRNYPSNCWWVAAAAEEVGREPLSRWLLEQRVVLFRTEDGAAVALEDRCAHRWAPLSRGKLCGDEIICPYHGLRYSSRGVCTFVPSQPSAPVPQRMRVKSYPVREHASFVWIWMGDPSKATPECLPDIRWLHDIDNFQWRSGHMEFGCNYMRVHENLMDFTHLAHLHADTITCPGVERAPEVDVADRAVSFVRKDHSVPAGQRAYVLGVEAGEMVDRTERGTFASPACFTLRHETLCTTRQVSYNAFVVHCVTPISPDRCHYWQAAQDCRQEGWSHAAAAIERIINQDREILEETQRTIERDIRGDAAPEISVRADRPAIEARRMLSRMLKTDSD